MNRLPELIPGRLLVLSAPYAAREIMLDFAARLARRSPLRVLDGGNRFNAYRVARVLHSLREPRPTQALGRISVARAFTCHQMVALLEQTPAGPIPILVIDLLDTFFDESVALVERQRLLARGVEHLRRLSARAVVVVSLRPPPPSTPDPTGLLEAVQVAADEVWIPEIPPTSPPPRLF